MILLAALALAVPGLIVVDPRKDRGAWEGWGTSLCWMGNAFGGRDDVADLLFTRKTVSLGAERVPGLGLNIVRYNAGASGRSEVEGRRMAVSKTILPYRQIDGFWLGGKSPDPNSKGWDWTADPRQRAMMRAAKARGADRFELFSNSPMWWMCANDNPSGAAKAEDDNLRPEMQDAFAVYLATVAAQAKRRWGVEFTTVEPFNEATTPYWYADGKQEGCHFSVPAQASILPRLRRELDRRGLRRTPIAASDETDFDHAIATWKGFDEPTRALVGQVNVHGYQGEKGDRRGLFEAVRGKRLWNSEHGEGDASGASLLRDLNLDLFALHPTAWCYWQPLDGGGWGLLAADMPRARILRTNPKYFVLAQYTRHVRPGMTILDTGDPDAVAAYDRRGRRLVIVAAGGAEGRDRAFDLSRFALGRRTVASWITELRGTARYERRPDRAFTGDSLTVALPANSVQTFEIENVGLARVPRP